MGHASRHAAKRIALQEQLEIDGYKARSVWGRWWQLDADFKARLFSQDESRWIRRYGARLDALANLAVMPRNDSERHFVAVAAHGGQPATERERLWLRVQVACRFEESVAKAALCTQALDVAAGLDAEARQLRIDLRDLEDLAVELQQELRLAGREPDAMYRHALCNVVYASPRFARRGDGPSPRRPIFDVAKRPAPNQRLPSSRAGLAP